MDEIRKALGSGRSAILLHSNADMDCVGSATALALHYGIGHIMAPAGISHLGKRLLSFLGLEALPQLETDGFDWFFVLDAQDDASLGYRGTPWHKAFVVDHHRSARGIDEIQGLNREEAHSCCEIIWDIIGHPEKMDDKIGYSLMAGILADTGNFRRGNHNTLEAASGILKASGLSLEDIMVLFESAEDQDMSRKISRLKGAQRMKHDRMGDWIVAVTEIGAFESAVCNGMLTLGADVAFAGSQNEESFRITGRANRSAVQAGIHMGDMFHRIAGECGGEGGGHDGAAGISGQGDVEAMLGICSENAISGFRGKKKRDQAREENVL